MLNLRVIGGAPVAIASAKQIARNRYRCFVEGEGGHKPQAGSATARTPIEKKRNDCIAGDRALACGAGVKSCGIGAQFLRRSSHEGPLLRSAVGQATDVASKNSPRSRSIKPIVRAADPSLARTARSA